MTLLREILLELAKSVNLVARHESYWLALVPAEKHGLTKEFDQTGEGTVTPYLYFGAKEDSFAGV